MNKEQDKIIQLKADVFDLIVQQEDLQNQINQIQQIKLQKIKLLNELVHPNA